MYFTEALWPDFNAKSLNLAILSYQQRERRFGRTSEQLEEERSPAAKADAVAPAKPLRRAKQNA